jgi:hypothetical protein
MSTDTRVNNEMHKKSQVGCRIYLQPSIWRIPIRYRKDHS